MILRLTLIAKHSEKHGKKYDFIRIIQKNSLHLRIYTYKGFLQ